MKLRTVKVAAALTACIAGTVASYQAIGSPASPDDPTMTARFVQHTAASYFAVNSQSEGGEAVIPGSAGPPGSGRSPGRLMLCVGVDDQILRMPAASGKCPQGQREFYLSGRDERVCVLCDPLDDAPPPASNNKAINALEERIRKLEKTPYFEVLNESDGRPIFDINVGGARFFNSARNPIAGVGTGSVGAYFTARSAVADTEASIGASGNKAGPMIFEAGIRTELGAREGPHALRFPSFNGLIAGLGQSRAGSGAVIVGALTGVTEASITVTDGRGFVGLSKDGGVGGASLAEALIGGGLLDLVTARGGSAVKMGHNGHRYGVVMTGPVLGVPYVPRTGIPGSYFVGCASGESPACLPIVAEQ